MKILASVLLFTVTAVGLGGCGEEKARTSAWYLENPKEIRKVLDKCKAENKKGYKTEGVLKENCQSARSAQRRMIQNAIQ